MLRSALLALVVTAAACTSASQIAPDASSPAGSTSTHGVTTIEEAPDATAIMWGPGGLPSSVVDHAAAVPGVAAATHLRSDTLGLVGARTADGTVVLDLDDRWRIPVDVVAVDPHDAATVIDDAVARAAVADLQPGQALLTEDAAERRGVGAGGAVRLLGGGEFTVAAIVPVGTLDATELVVHVADADGLGMRDGGAVVVRLTGSELPHDELTALAPHGSPVRLDGGVGGARSTPVVLGLDEVKDRFGEFAFRDDDPDREIWPDPDWVDEHIVIEEVPILGRVRCHEAIMDDLRAGLQAIVDAGLAGEIDPSEYGGCYHPRRIGSRTERLSRHSWGIAVDLNVDFSVAGMGTPMDRRAIDLLAQHGFRWGGDFLTPDNHHFEWVGPAAAEGLPPIATGRGPS